jgi:hypothetical protein
MPVKSAMFNGKRYYQILASPNTRQALMYSVYGSGGPFAVLEGLKKSLMKDRIFFCLDAISGLG